MIPQTQLKPASSSPTGWRQRALPVRALLWLSLMVAIPWVHAQGAPVAGSKFTESSVSETGDSGTKAISTQRNLRMARVLLEDGLAQRRINDVLQDPKGFIWVGTEDGLFRYDGVRVQNFHYSRADPNSLSHDQVTALYCDSDGVLWVATNGGGLNRYLGADQGFQRWQHDPNDASSLSSNRVSSITADSSGQLWVGTANAGLNLLTDDGFKRFAHDAALHTSLPNDAVTAVLEDKRGNLWVGTDGGGLSRFDKRSERFVSYQTQSNSAQNLSSNRITRLYEDQQARFWVATADAGLNLFDRERQTFTTYQHEPGNTQSLAGNYVTDMLLDTGGSLWVATQNGLHELRSDGTFARYQHNSNDTSSLASDRIYRLQQDADGVLWVATHEGLNRWNYLSDAFQHFSARSGHLPSSLVTAVAEGLNKELWVGTKREGLTRIDRDTGTRTQYQHDPNDPGSLPNNHIVSLYTANNGDLWVGTAAGSVARLVVGATAFQPITDLQDAPSIDMGRVQVIAGGFDDRVWIGTSKAGLWEVHDNRVRIFQREVAEDVDTQGLSDNNVVSIFQESAGPLWVGTKNGDLNRFDPSTEQFTVAHVESDRGSHAALDITVSKDGTFWAGTAGGGLLRWNADDRAAGRQQFTHLSKDNGLPSNSIRGILEDQNGALWLSSNRGLARFDPLSQQTRHFNQRNGLRGDYYYPGAKLHSRSGQLFFGGNAGLVAFYPSAITQLRDQPRLVLEAATRQETLGRTFNEDDADPLSITLDHQHDYVSFRFAALNYVSPDQNRYLYQLAGFDAGWIDPQDTLVATYTSLPAGDYEFLVKAANPEGLWSEHPARINLTVTAPPWASPMAMAIYILLVIGLIGFFVARLATELARVRSSRRTLEAQVELRTLELEERNRQLEELNHKLQEASITDPLTGLLNRRSFYEFVSREVAAVERGYTNHDGQANPQRRHLFFMMIDLDGFKPINDTFGHHTGDHTLVQVSELLTSCAREADTVFRWGGDEFLIIGQVSESADLEVLAERFRATIAEHRFDPKYGKALRLSASVGVAPYPFCESNPGIATWEQVADVADLAAYLAKTHGKNAWVCARGNDGLSAQSLQQVKDNLELLIESGMIEAISSATETPIPGATQR